MLFFILVLYIFNILSLLGGIYILEKDYEIYFFVFVFHNV